MSDTSLALNFSKGTTMYTTIATSPWIKEAGYLNRRIVIRESEYDYSVETEIQLAEITHYHTEDYFPKGPLGVEITPETTKAAFKLAWRRFEVRSRGLCNI